MDDPIVVVHPILQQTPALPLTEVNPTVSSGKTIIVAILAVFVGNDAFGSATECPSTLDGKKLTGVDLYDGPISEMADLIPQDGGWRLGYPAASGKGFFLRCRYGGKTLELLLPAGVKACLFENYPRVLCE